MVRAEQGRRGLGRGAAALSAPGSKCHSHGRDLSSTFTQAQRTCQGIIHLLFVHYYPICSLYITLPFCYFIGTSHCLQGIKRLADNSIS